MIGIGQSLTQEMKDSVPFAKVRYHPVRNVSRGAVAFVEQFCVTDIANIMGHTALEYGSPTVGLL